MGQWTRAIYISNDQESKWEQNSTKQHPWSSILSNKWNRRMEKQINQSNWNQAYEKKDLCLANSSITSSGRMEEQKWTHQTSQNMKPEESWTKGWMVVLYMSVLRTLKTKISETYGCCCL